jgi:hypothetical protein
MCLFVIVQVQPCTLTTAKETFGPGQLVIGLPPGSNLTANLTTAMLSLGETGKITGKKLGYWGLKELACTRCMCK